MRKMNRRANRLAAMRSPASEQAALTYTVKLIQEGPF